MPPRDALGEGGHNKDITVGNHLKFKILTVTVLLKKFSVESHITVGFSAFLSSIGM